MIPDRKSIADYKSRLAHLKNNYNDFLKVKITEHANKIIVDEIIRRMQQNKFSDKIWTNTYLKEVKITDRKIIVTIESKYTIQSGFDVAVAREFGTKDHFIQPISKTHGSQFSKLDKNVVAKLPKVLSWIQNGVRMFSKGHMVSGMKSLRIINKTIKEKRPELQAKINEEFEKWMVRVFTE